VNRLMLKFQSPTLILRISFVGILGFALIISCTKDSPEKHDNIVYQKFYPAINMSSVQNYTLQDHAVCTAYIPNPEDSTITYNLDINNDQLPDFLIEVSHNWWEPTQYCGHCSIYEYQITISGINPGDSIGVDSNFSGFYASLDTLDEISHAEHWKEKAY